MPATYEPIATTTLGSAAASITFSSIASSWTDLRLVLVATASGGTKFLRFKSSTIGYNKTWILGDGSSATSGRSTSYPRLDLNSQDTGDSTPSLDTVDVFSYAGSTNKTCLMTSSHDENGSGQVMRQVGLWANTAAITQIDLLLSSSNTWSAGTTATLYGIKNA